MWFSQWWCKLFTDHKESLMVRDGGRVRMKCFNCGYESPGWDLRTPATGGLVDP